MTDHKVQAGDPISATKWNSVVDRLSSDALGLTTGADTATMSRVVVLVKNTTGGPLDVGELAAITDYTGPDTANPSNIAEGIVLIVSEPKADTHNNQLVVASEPIPADQIGRAVIKGLCLVSIEFSGEEGDLHQGLSLNEGNYKKAKSVVMGGFASVSYYPPKEGGGLPDYAFAIIGQQESQVIYAEVQSEATAKKYNCKIADIGADLWGGGPASEEEFEVDLSDQDSYVQPMIPEAVGFSHSDKDSLILCADHLGKWKWAGSNKYIARWVTGSVSWTPNGGDQDVEISVQDFWEGYNPGPRVPAKMPGAKNFDCDEEITATVTACFQPDNDKRQYFVVSTDSALLGPPGELDIPQGPLVSQGANSGDGQLCYDQAQQPAYVFGCKAGTNLEDALCIDGKELYEQTLDELCEAICECPQFAYSEFCDDCENTCSWMWDENASDWTLQDDTECVSPCVCGPKPSRTGLHDGEIVNVGCVSYPPECGRCEWHWNASESKWDLVNSDCTREDCYCESPPLGDGETDGEIRYEDCYPSECGYCEWVWNGAEWNLTTDGNYCVGDSNCVCVKPGYDGSTVGETAKTDCEGSQCCENCNGEKVNITGYGVDIGAINCSSTQNGPSVVVTDAPEGTCAWDIPVDVADRIDADQWLEYTDTVRVTYDGTTWSASQGISQHNGYNLDWTKDDICLGGLNVTCQNGGNCPPNGTGAFVLSMENCPDASAVVKTANQAGERKRNSRLGDRFAKAYPELVRGCACKRDVIHVMNRWTRTNVTPEKIKRVAETLATRNPDVSQREFVTKLKDFLDNAS